uniref:Uncharacterized protein n=1 Tax=Anopheles melas TaxID=34690 RepID=A0A182TQW6_9DIPT
MLNQVNHIWEATLHQAKLLLVKPAIFDAAGQIVHALAFQYVGQQKLPARIVPHDPREIAHTQAPYLVLHGVLGQLLKRSIETTFRFADRFTRIYQQDRFRVRYANEFITTCRCTGYVIENGIIWHDFLDGFCFLGNHHNLFLTFSPYCARKFQVMFSLFIIQESLNCWRMIGHYPSTASKVRL